MKKSNHYKVGMSFREEHKGDHSANDESVCVMPGRLLYQTKEGYEAGRKLMLFYAAGPWFP